MSALMEAIPDCSSDRFRTWLDRELQQERLFMMEFVAARHTLLLQKFDSCEIELTSNDVTFSMEAGNSPSEEGGQESDGHKGDEAHDPGPHNAHDKSNAGEKQQGFQRFTTFSSNPMTLVRAGTSDKLHKVWLHMPQSVLETVENPVFEFVFTILIILSAFQITLQLQYDSFDIAASIQVTVPSPQGMIVSPTSALTWPGMNVFLDVLNYTMGVLFIIEALMKMKAYGLRFVCSAWNVFDTIVVGAWIFDQAYSGDMNFNPMIMRLARLARVLRMFKLMKALKGLDSLKLIVCCIAGSGSILFWSLMVLLAVMMLMGTVFSFMLQPEMINDNLDLETRQQLFRLFGSFTRAMLTMFEVTIANWVPVTRMLAENVGEFWAFVIVSYNIFVGFAVVTVIRGVFLRETFQVAANDDDLMVVENQNSTKAFGQKMHNLISIADSSGEGLLDKEEFKKVLKNVDTRHWLRAMGLTIRNEDEVWQLLADGRDAMDTDQLCKGIARIKGTAQALDLQLLSNDVKAMQTTIDRLRLEVVSLPRTPRIPSEPSSPEPCKVPRSVAQSNEDQAERITLEPMGDACAGLPQNIHDFASRLKDSAEVGNEDADITLPNKAMVFSFANTGCSVPECRPVEPKGGLWLMAK